MIDVEEYLSNGIKDLVKSLRSVNKNRTESTFLLHYATHAGKAHRLRRTYEQRGEHIPPFLIFSITNECNLHCAGCYALHNTDCSQSTLPMGEWNRLFDEATRLGVSMILLAGGEPLLRKDVLKLAAGYRELLFPVFTNGTLWNDDDTVLFDQNRHLVPMLSMEGFENDTDSRRGAGVHAKVYALMHTLKEKEILFGASVTVTKENLGTVTGAPFTNSLAERGCRVILFVEYVPFALSQLALDDDGRRELDERVTGLRQSSDNMLYITFPGDERATGGCLAAGRGFFHINASGSVEPCPFSPVSDTNIAGHSLREALRSPLFTRLQASNLLNTSHVGGCALFERKEEVEALL